MSARPVSPGLKQFVEDELLRGPLLFDQLIEGAVDNARLALAGMRPSQRAAIAGLLETLRAQKPRLAEYFTRSLASQARRELAGDEPPGTVRPLPVSPRESLSLVDESVVALDVELSQTIEAIKSVAEYELRELQTFTAALVGDMEVASDYNPFRAETYARALWDAAQALPMAAGYQVAFVRHARMPLANLLRKSYAAACSRLESQGVEPAAYRTLILPAGSRRGHRHPESTFSPDLLRMRDSMPAPLDTTRSGGLRYEGQTVSRASTLAGAGQRHEFRRSTSVVIDRQTVELVGRLFEAIAADERVPSDVGFMISRLQAPVMRLTLNDANVLEQNDHPLWKFINRLAFEAEMTPDRADPERVQLLAVAQGAVDRLNSDTEQTVALYRWAFEQIETLLHRRLARRLSAASSQIGAFQKLEDRLVAGEESPTSLHGMLDLPRLDTVPAELLDVTDAKSVAAAADDAWLDGLSSGDWVRMFMRGAWVRARLLWPGERREIWLFGDGASDETWAVRRDALLTMKAEKLIKKITERSIVGSAARRVQESLTGLKRA